MNANVCRPNGPTGKKHQRNVRNGTGPKDVHAVPGLGLARPVQNASGASSARRAALLRALGWGSRLALEEKPTKPNQTKVPDGMARANCPLRLCDQVWFLPDLYSSFGLVHVHNFRLGS